MTTALRNYTRWTQGDQQEIHADILGTDMTLHADPRTGTIVLNHKTMTPDEARLIGVRLIEAAALADGDRAIRARH